MPCVTAMHTRWNVLAEQFHTITTNLVHTCLHSTKHVSRATLHNFNASNSMHTHTWAPPFYFAFVENRHYTNLLTALFSNTVQQTIHNSLSTYNHQQLCNSEAHCLHDANRCNVAVSLMQSIWTMMLELRHWTFHSMHTYKLAQTALSRYTSIDDTHSAHRTECNSHAEQISIGKNGCTIRQNAQSHAKQITENTQPAGTEK